MKDKKILILFTCLLLPFFLFSEGETGEFQLESISEALQSPYQYQSVNVITGEYCENHTDLSLKGNVPIDLRRYYTSQDPIAHGWHFNHPNILHAEGEIPSDWIPEPLQYTFDEKNRLTAISTKEEGPERIRFSYTDGDESYVDVETEDHTHLTYSFKTYQTSRAVHPYVLTKITDHEGWEVNYQYVDHPKERRLLLKKREEPNGRYLITEYYDSTANNVGGKIVVIADPNRDPRIGKVKQQKAPVGVDDTPIITNRFFYEPGYTEVYDAVGNKTIYRYGKLQKMIGVDHYWNENKLYRKERIFWDANGLMTSRSIEDQEGVIHLLHSYEYDKNGNMSRTTVWGNLSGAEDTSIQISFDGQPLDKTIEHYSTIYTYSDDGKHLLKEASDNGLVTHYRYHDDKLVAKLIGEEGHIQRRYFYHYDDQGIVIEEIEDDGSSFKEGKLTSVTERHFTRITPKQDEPAKGKPEIIEKSYFDFNHQTECLITKVKLSYSVEGEVVHKAIYDADLNITHENIYEYDETGRLVYTNNHLDEEQSFTYDLHGNLTHQTEKEFDLVHTYDFANRLIKKEQWKDGEVKECLYFQYDYAGNQTASIDSNGNETHYEYDPMGRLSKTILPTIVNADNIPIRPTIKQTYDIFNRVTKSTDPKGYCTKTCYNVWGKPTAVIHPDGSQETFEYYLDGSLKRKVTQHGSSINYHRDVFSRITKEEHFDHKGNYLGEKTFSYSPFRLLSETNLDGCSTNYTYDGAGRQTKVTRGDHYRLEITYDAIGQIESKKEWYGEAQDEYVIGVIERDDRQEVIAMAVQDSRGELLRHQELLTHDEGDLVTYDDEQFYNDLGQNVLKRTEVNGKGESTITTFDALNRPVSIAKRNAMGALLTLKEVRYDLAGNKEREIHHILRDEKEVGTYIINWAWGPNNRLESVTEGYGSSIARTTTYHYNSEGLLEKTIKPDNVALLFTYNCNGQVERLASSDHTIDYRYYYDDLGRVTEVANNVSHTHSQRVFDQSGQMVSETLANGLDLEYEYDFLGRLVKMILPDESGVSWNYNAAFLTEISRLSASGKKVYSHALTNFDLKGRLLQSEMICNLGTLNYTYQENTINSIQSDYWKQWSEFDDTLHLKTLTTEDPIGEITNFFDYNDLDQVIEEVGIDYHSFMYDSIGNLASLDGNECSVDCLNQLLSAGSRTMTYDKNGQMTECWEDGKHFLFSYDALGRLITVTKEKESQMQMTYDPFGRRLSKSYAKYRAKDQTFITKNTERYLWEGENEIGAVNENGDITQLRVLGFGLGAEVGAAVAIEIDQKLYAPIHDHRGNVCCLVDSDTAEPVEWYHYTAYGEMHQFSMQYKPTGNPWKFSSKRVDEESGLVYFGKRYYMPGVARWISKDPMGTPESINRYAYSLNQPLTRIDPYGLFSFGDLWNSFTDFMGNALHYTDRTIKALKNKLSFEDYIRPAITDAGEMVLGKMFLQLSGFYQDKSEMGVHGKGELNDKVRITLVNGILNARCDYKQSLDIISNCHGGVNIHYLFDATNGWTNDMLRAFISRMGHISPISYQLVDMWRDLIDEMGGVGQGGLIIHYAHSIGATHTKNALSLLSPQERAMIRVYTFGAPTTISDSGLESVKNFISYRDGVSMLDPIGYFAGLLGLSEDIAMVGTPWGIPFIEHTLNGGAYYDIIKILGVHFMKHYLGVN